MKSIKIRLIIYFGILVILITSSIGFLSLQRASESIAHEAEQGLQVIAFEGTKLTESRAEIEENTLEMIAAIEDIQSMDRELQIQVLQRQLPNTKFLALGIVFPDGATYYNDGTTAELGDRGYVKRAFDGETNISDLLISRVTNEPVLMYATPIKRNGKIVGVLIGRSDGNSLSEITNLMGYGKSGYAYMINGEGTVIAHPEKEKVLNQWNPIKEAENNEELKSMASQFSKILEEKNGVSSYSSQGSNFYSGYHSIEGTDWILIITADEKEVLSGISVLQKDIMLFTLVILLISIIITYLTGNSIAKPIISITEHSKKLADLDITENVPQNLLNKKDEVGNLGKALQSITDNLRDIISDIGESSEQVSASSQELTATSQQSAIAAEEVSKTIEEIARSASEQARNTEEGASKAIALGETIEKDQVYMKNVKESSQRVSKVVNEGLKEIERLTNISDESRVATDEVHEGIIRTNDSANRIGDASRVIASIAEQTNLLALNAAIEAARAGEAGRGFSVVAEEIRKLAEESTASTKSIDEVVSELQSNSKDAVEIMERVAAILKEQGESVKLSKEKYMTIATAIKETEEAIDELNISGQEMDKMKDEIMDALQNLSAIAEENSASTEEVSASMEEQTASMGEISSASEGLSKLAQDLQSIIMKFRI